MSRSPEVTTGAQPTRAPLSATPATVPARHAHVFESSQTSNLMDRALNGEGSLYFSTVEGLWCVVRSTPRLENARGQILQRSERVEFRFRDNLFFLDRKNKDYDEIKAYIEGLTGYGLTVRPMEEIARENKARALAEARKVLASVTPGEETKTILSALAPQISQMSREDRLEMARLLDLNNEGAESEPSEPVAKQPASRLTPPRALTRR